MSNEAKTYQSIEDYRGSIPVWKKVPYAVRDRIKRSMLYAGIAGVLFFVVFPLFWMWSSALRSQRGLFAKPAPLLPADVTFTHFSYIINQTAFITYYVNSIIYAVGVVVITVVFSTLGGYGLTRINIPHKKLFARGVLFGYMFPAILLAIPMFILWRRLNLTNSMFGLMLAETAVSLPFSLWLMWKFFQTVPYSLEESAQMAGASRFRAFFEIALPLAKPGMIAVAVYAYAVSWNQFTIPRVIMSDSAKWPLTVGLATFQEGNQVLWGPLMAASALIILPSFLFVYFLQRYLLRGFRAGSVG